MANRLYLGRPRLKSSSGKYMLVNPLLITHKKSDTNRMYTVRVNPITLRVSSSYLRPILTIDGVTFYYMKDKYSDNNKYVIFISNKDCIKVAKMFDGFSTKYPKNILGFRIHKNFMSFIKFLIKNYECDSIHMKYLHKPIKESLKRLFNSDVDNVVNLIENV